LRVNPNVSINVPFLSNTFPNMTDYAMYWSDWAVAEREAEILARHKETCMGCTWCVGVAPAAVAAAPAPVSRAAAVAKWDDCPLVAAAATGDVAWMKELLAAGADVNEYSSPNEYSPLIVAAQKGHAEVVHTLLQTGVCDLTKKHMDGYISALESALHGYNNLEGCEDEFAPEIRAMIIRAHVETADRIDLVTLLHIEASGAVVPEHIKAFRSGMGARMARLYSKALPGKLNLSDPPAAKMQAVMTAALAAARRIAAERDAAAVAAAVAAGKVVKLKKVAGPSVAPTRFAAAVGGAGGGAGCADEDDEDDAERHPMYKRKTAVAAYDPMLDDSYGKMSRRFRL
jgi:hypothetical protein